MLPGLVAVAKSHIFPPHPSELSSAYTTEADQSADEEDSFDAAPCNVLSLDERNRPVEPAIGYYFGTGNLGNYPGTAGVLLLLPSADSGAQWAPTISSSTARLIYPRQGYFAFDPKYGRLWIHSRHKGILVDDSPVHPKSKILLEGRARISISPYRFIFEFKVPEEKSSQEAKQNNLTRYHGGEALHDSTSVTPSINDIRIQNWILHGIVGASPVSFTPRPTFGLGRSSL